MQDDVRHSEGGAGGARYMTGELARLDGLDRIRDAAGDTPAYLVGGTVRDLLLGKGDRSDIDVVVEGEVEPIARRLGGETRSHERFGTATVTAGSLIADLATARTETYAQPGALPHVRRAALADDLARRDFTINAMAVPLQGEPRLIDPHGGAADLEAGRLRVLHDRSFVDDPTRALRAARYAARLGFDLDPRAAELVRLTDLGTVSEDRREAELQRLAAESSPRRGFELLDEWGQFDLHDQGGELIDLVVDLVSEEPWRDATHRPAVVLAAARGEVGRAQRLAALEPATPSEGVEAARGASGVELALARAMGGRWLDTYLAEWRNVGLEITGEDLIAAGVAQGPDLGRGLRVALARKLDGEIAGREAELAAALEAARTGAGREA
jgi:tRNA nucleotidyltransferase (CCA-adding enzyme)